MRSFWHLFNMIASRTNSWNTYNINLAKLTDEQFKSFCESLSNRRITSLSCNLFNPEESNQKLLERMLAFSRALHFSHIKKLNLHHSALHLLVDDKYRAFRDALLNVEQLCMNANSIYSWRENGQCEDFFTTILARKKITMLQLGGNNYNLVRLFSSRVICEAFSTSSIKQLFLGNILPVYYLSGLSHKSYLEFCQIINSPNLEQLDLSELNLLTIERVQILMNTVACSTLHDFKAKDCDDYKKISSILSALIAQMTNNFHLQNLKFNQLVIIPEPIIVQLKRNRELQNDINLLKEFLHTVELNQQVVKLTSAIKQQKDMTTPKATELRLQLEKLIESIPASHRAPEQIFVTDNVMERVSQMIMLLADKTSNSAKNKISGTKIFTRTSLYRKSALDA